MNLLVTFDPRKQFDIFEVPIKWVFVFVSSDCLCYSLLFLESFLTIHPGTYVAMSNNAAVNQDLTHKHTQSHDRTINYPQTGNTDILKYLLHFNDVIKLY